MNETFKNLLKKPWASQLHDNQNHDTEKPFWIHDIGSMCKEGRSLSDIVLDAFRWSDTPQGDEYWREIKNGLY